MQKQYQGFRDYLDKLKKRAPEKYKKLKNDFQDKMNKK